MRPSQRTAVLRLLRASRPPLVSVGKSTAEGGGQGVFAGPPKWADAAWRYTAINAEGNGDGRTTMRTISAGTVLALYPGIWTPPLPVTSGEGDVFLSNDFNKEYLEENAYILNLGKALMRQWTVCVASSSHPRKVRVPVTAEWRCLSYAKLSVPAPCRPFCRRTRSGRVYRWQSH